MANFFLHLAFLLLRLLEFWLIEDLLVTFDLVFLVSLLVNHRADEFKLALQIVLLALCQRNDLLLEILVIQLLVCVVDALLLSLTLTLSLALALHLLLLIRVYLTNRAIVLLIAVLGAKGDLAHHYKFTILTY